MFYAARYGREDSNSSSASVSSMLSNRAPLCNYVKCIIDSLYPLLFYLIKENTSIAQFVVIPTINTAFIVSF